MKRGGREGETGGGSGGGGRPEVTAGGRRKDEGEGRKAEEGGRPGLLLRGLLVTIRYLVLPALGLGHLASQGLVLLTL